MVTITSSPSNHALETRIGFMDSRQDSRAVLILTTAVTFCRLLHALLQRYMIKHVQYRDTCGTICTGERQAPPEDTPRTISRNLEPQCQRHFILTVEMARLRSTAPRTTVFHTTSLTHSFQRSRLFNTEYHNSHGPGPGRMLLDKQTSGASYVSRFGRPTLQF